MGISGLLQFIKDASEPISVKKYKGQVVAVDTYCWLHKGAFACAEKLAKGEPTDQYVAYCMKFVNMLLSFGVKPILVFDGQNLPSKEEVEQSRRERRQANLQKGKQLLREGKLSEARDCFTRCVNVTSTMAHGVIKAARAWGVDCLVAPYEADAQLAFLNKAGIAQAVITEDSDLLAFGCKKVILKMDKLGNGLEVDQKNLGRCRSLGDVFTEDKFRYMCILSGCDYLASLHGIGLGKACKLLKVANNPDILKVIRKMGQYLKMNVTVPDEYLEGFTRANNTFLYQLVFEPLSRKVVPLNPYPDDMDPAALHYAGHHVGDEKGLQMALGNLDINTMKVIDDYDPDTAQPPKPRSRGWDDDKGKASPLGHSIWSKSYSPGGAPSSPSAALGSRETSSGRGRAAAIGVPALRVPAKVAQMKRLRQESDVSEDDVLSQYSSPSLKKQRLVEEPLCAPAHPGSPDTQPRTRNRFATLLQRRNQEDGSGVEGGTRSRFFCNISTMGPICPKQGTAPEAEHQAPTTPEHQAPTTPEHQAPTSPEHQAPTSPEHQAPTTPEHQAPTSPEHQAPTTPAPQEVEQVKLKDEGAAPDPRVSPSSRPSHCRVFGWTGICENKPQTEQRPSGLSLLQRFQHKKGSVAWGARPHRSPSPTPSPPQDQEESTELSPSQDSAYFSQPSRFSVGTEQSHNQDLEANRGSISGETEETKPIVIRAKVSGLPRTGSMDITKRANIKPSAPARASGLRKKSDAKKNAYSNENRPGLQATISSLWKSFSFRKENPRCKAGEPMSPVKDIVSSLTPETDKDVYFISGSKSIQKHIFF